VTFSVRLAPPPKSATGPRPGEETDPGPDPVSARDLDARRKAFRRGRPFRGDDAEDARPEVTLSPFCPRAATQKKPFAENRTPAKRAPSFSFFQAPGDPGGVLPAERADPVLPESEANAGGPSR